MELGRAPSVFRNSCRGTSFPTRCRASQHCSADTDCADSGKSSGAVGLSFSDKTFSRTNAGRPSLLAKRGTFLSNTQRLKVLGTLASA